MNRSDNINELAAALAKAQGEIKGAVKDAKNPFFDSTYADLASVWEAIREPMSKNGLSVVQFPEEDANGKLVLYTMLAHASGQWVASFLPITPGYTNKAGDFVPLYDPQAMGSAITYARRYSLQAAAGVAPMDDDGNAASGKDRDDVAPKGANLPRRPQEPQEITGRWQDVINHIGKQGGPIKGKALGQLADFNRAFLLKSLREKPEGKLPAADRRLLAALCMWEAESQPQSQDKVVETPPVTGNARDEAIKAITGLLEWNGIPEEIFWTVGLTRKWFEKHGWENVTEAQAIKIQENIEAAIGHCQAAMKPTEEKPA